MNRIQGEGEETVMVHEIEVGLDMEENEKEEKNEIASFGEQNIPFPTNSGASLRRAIYSIVCAIAGVGVLGLPYSLKQGGWSAIAALIILGLMLLYTGVRMAHCLLYDPEIVTYADLGYKAFGNWGKYAVLVSQIVNCVGSSILFLVLAGQNMNLIFAGLNTGISQSLWTIIIAAVILPMCYLKTMHEVGIIALFGTLACVLAVIIVLVEDFVADVPRNHDYNTGSVTGFLQAVATMCFAYGGHVIFPSVIRVMGHNQKKFPQAVYWSYIIVIVMYVPIAVVSFYQFGVLTEDNILKNLGSSIPVKITEAALTAHVMFAYVVFMNPVFFIIERKIKVDKLSSKLHEKKTESCCTRWMYSSAELLIRIFTRTLIVGFTVLVAILIPFFSDLMSFIGGSAQAASILILPALIYLKLYFYKMPLYEKIFNIGTCIIGSAVGIAATVFAVINIIDKLSKEGVKFNF